MNHGEWEPLPPSRQGRLEFASLEQHLAFLGFALDSVREAVFLISQDGRFRYVNQESCRILEYAPEPLLELGVADVDPDFPMERWHAHWAEIKARRSLTFESRHQTREGRVFPVEVNANYFEFDGQGYDLALVRDISERRRTLDLLRQREAELNESQRLAHIGSWDWDTVQDRIWWSDEYCRLCGFDPEKPAPNHLEHLGAYVPESATRLDEAVQRAMAHGEPYKLDLELRTSSASRSWIQARGEVKRDELGRIRGLRGTAQSITERKRAEEERLEAQRLFRALVETSPDIIARYDRECRRTYVNPTYLRVAGIPQRELVATAPLTRSPLPSEGARELQLLLGRVLQGGRAQAIDLPWRKEDGLEYWYNVYAFPELDPTGQVMGVMTISRDITGRKEAERALHHLNRELRAISDCNQTLLRAQDEATLLADICRIVCDEAGYRLAWVVMVDEADPGGMRLAASACLAAEDMDGHLEACLEAGRGLTDAVLASGRTLCIQAFATDPRAASWKGRALQCGCLASISLPVKDEASSAIGVLNIFSAEANAFTAEEIRLLEELSADLAFGVAFLRLRKARLQAFEKESQLAAIVESSDDAIIGKTLDGIITNWNRGAENLYGHTRAEVQGKSISVLSPPEVQDEYLHILDRVRRGEHIEHLETVRMRKDGKRIQVSLTVSPVCDPQGRIIAVSSVARDITEKNKLEAQLRQAQKMEAVGQLAGGIAHDFNNILTAIIGFSNLAKMKLEPQASVQPLIDQILAASDRAAHLTKGLLAFSRKQVLLRKPIDLGTVVRSVEALLRRLIGEDVELSTRLTRDDLVVLGDSGQIGQVLMNLATNARDAMPHGGQLSLATQAQALGEDFVKAHGFGIPGRYAQITVSDTGIGMEAATRAKMYDPFFTTKEPGKGTGLGLSMVYGIVKQHGGFITVYSEPGIGTTFQIYLPLVAEVLKAAGGEDATPPVGGGETLLVAEDDPNVRNLTCTVLRDFGYRVIEAVDGRDGVEKFREHAEEISLLVLDLLMPRMNGQEAFAAMKATHPGLKAIFISGYTPDSIQQMGLFQEKVRFLQKPMSPHELLRMVRRILDEDR